MAVNEYDFFDTDPMYAANAENAEKTADAHTPKSDGMHDTEPVKFPIPESDYKDGKLKKVRGRMLKKLLKYELQDMLLPVLIGSAILLFAALFLGLQIRAIGKQISLDPTWVTLSVTLYTYSVFAMLILPIGLSDRRMRKNFFKGEGAVTFSIPASAEEHLLAKHLGTIIVGGISVFVSLLSIVILILLLNPSILKGIFDIQTETKRSIVSQIFFVIEGVVFASELCVGVPVLIGASCCLTQRFSGKKNWTFGLMAALIFIAVSNVSTVLFFTSGAVKLLETELGTHLFIWGQLLLGAGLIVLCFLYELRTIKYKINL